MTTKQSIICNKLQSQGLKEVRNPSTSKYRVFTRADGQHYFVGKNGALRVGLTVGDSISLPVNPKLFEVKK